MRSSLSHRSPLCLPGEGWASGRGKCGGRGDLAARISSKKGWPDAQPPVLQGLAEAPREQGTGAGKEQRWKKRDVSSRFFQLAVSLIKIRF